MTTWDKSRLPSRHVTVGPERATESIRKALSMGADKAIHVTDEALHGSDAVATAKVLA